MAAVYLGEHRIHGYRVAIKVLHAYLVRNEEMVERFLAEAQAAARVHHPGIVDVFESGRDESGVPYLVMDYLEGESLSARALKRRLHPREVTDIASQVAGPLAAAHRAGIIHRDLKPDNVFITRDPVAFNLERVKLLDFGVAKFIDDDRTNLGSVFGTPYYMSPEQIDGAEKAGPESDVYSLGCILYELLCGVTPFRGPLQRILVAHRYERPRPPSELDPSVPPALESVVLRMLEKSPEKRPRSMPALIAELTAALPAAAPSERPAA